MERFMIQVSLAANTLEQAGKFHRSQAINWLGNWLPGQLRMLLDGTDPAPDTGARKNGAWFLDNTRSASLQFPFFSLFWS
jgi:hypothetical protein